MNDLLSYNPHRALRYDFHLDGKELPEVKHGLMYIQSPVCGAPGHQQ